MTDDRVNQAPPVPRHVQVKDIPEHLSRELHRLAYETGRTKRDLIIEAIESRYGHK